MAEPVIYNIEIVDKDGMFYDTLESYTVPFVEGQKIEFTLSTGDRFDRNQRFDTLLITDVTHYITRSEIFKQDKFTEIKCKYNVTVKVQRLNPFK